MKIRQKLSGTVSIAVLTASVLICGCSTPGASLFKTKTEQAVLSWSKGQNEDAVHYAQKALEKDPNDLYALMVAGLAYENLGYPNQAKAMYERASVLNKKDRGVFGAVRNSPVEELKKTAAERLKVLTLPEDSLVIMDENTPVFINKANPSKPENNAYQKKTAEDEIKGGLDMLEEGDRNLVLRFLIFNRLKDEKYVTPDEWLAHRSANLGGLLPYTLTPAAKGLDLPSPSGDAITGRLDALRKALEIRAITPQEHAAERDIILDALLPPNPFYRMEAVPFPRDMMEGATAMRRIETLKNIGVITPDEAKKEKEAIEKLTYAKLGMTGGNAKPNVAASKCIQKCLNAPPANPCSAAKPAVKKKPVKKAPAPVPVKKPPEKKCTCE